MHEVEVEEKGPGKVTRESPHRGGDAEVAVAVAAIVGLNRSQTANAFTGKTPVIAKLATGLEMPA